MEERELDVLERESRLLCTACEQPELRKELYQELFYLEGFADALAFQEKTDWHWGWKDLPLLDGQTEKASYYLGLVKWVEPLPDWRPVLKAQKRLIARLAKEEIHKDIAETYANGLDLEGAAKRRSELEDRLSLLASDKEKTEASLKYDMLEPFFKETEERRGTGVLPTGYAELDGEAGGLRKGNAILWCAPTGDGKTTSMLNLALNCALRGSRTVFWSGEQTKEDLAARIAGMWTAMKWDDPVEYWRFMHFSSDESKDAFFKATGEIGEAVASGGGSLELWTPEEKPSASSSVNHGKDVDLVFCDYLSLFGGLGMEDKQWAKMGDAVAVIQSFCRRTGLVAVIGAQWHEKEARPRYTEGAMEHAPYVYWYVLPRSREGGKGRRPSRKSKKGDGS